MQANPFILITGSGEIAVALLFTLYWKRKHGISWGFFGWGALAWVVGVAVKFAVGSLISDGVLSFLEQALPKYIADTLSWLFVGSLTGIFEGGAALLFVAITRVKNADWKQAVGFGNGFGSFEALLLGLFTLAVTLVGLLAPQSLPPEALSQLQLPPGSVWLWVAVGPVERALTIIVHIFSAVLVVYAWRARRWGYFGLTILYKTAVDAVGAFGLMSYGGLETLSRIWTLEAILFIIALVGWWGTAALRPRFGHCSASVSVGDHNTV